jgi:pilus assembly protein CpaB
MSNMNKWWRWKFRTDAVLLLAAILAGTAAAVMAGRFLGARAKATEASLQGRYEARAVVVAAADLSQGESLDATRLAVRKMPREFLPLDAVPADRAAELIGAQTAIRIRRGTPVVAAALRSNMQSPRLASVLSGEQRALTIAVDQVNSQAGNLLPGDWVDLYYSRSEGGGATLVPLLQRVAVLAAGSELHREEDAMDATLADRHYSTITLGLTAADAARVVLAQQSGSLSVVLRSPDDQSQLPAEPRSSHELLRPTARRPEASSPARVEVLVGGSGGLVPERTWLAVGQSRSSVEGDAS